MNKVVLIGCGNVGMSYAYALLNQDTQVDELVLIDINEEKTLGEVMDLNHCLAYSPTKIKISFGSYKEVENADLIVIAAGANQAPGETRMDLINKNSRIFKNIIKDVMDNNFKGIFLVATNPLDVMTYLTLKYSGMDPKRVIGSGTTLDTSRLRYMISEKTNINPEDIDVFVVGEHGDSEFVAWSNANIAASSITNFLTSEEMNKIEDEVRNSAYEIIKRKGATFYGIGMCLARITKAIFNNESVILPVSSWDAKNEICISTPAVVNREGVLEKIFIPLNQEEEASLTNSINVIKSAIRDINE